MVGTIDVQEVFHRGEQVALAYRPMEHSIQSHRIQPRQLILVLDAGDADVPAACGVLSLAGLKEGLLVGTVQGEDDEVEALAPHEKLGGHAIADHLELMIGPFRPQHSLDQAHGLGIIVEHQDGFGGRRVSPFQHSGQLQAVDRRDHVHHVQPSFAGDVPEGAGAVQQRVDFDFGIRQARPVGVAASSRLASEDELPPLVEVEPGARMSSAINKQGRHAQLERQRLEHGRQACNRLEGELARLTGQTLVRERQRPETAGAPGAVAGRRGSVPAS